mmetsp:Transcript_40823/g.68250  ORF Transcript_40823/g.68250 Transcript_40823/m.68250 type:complete len:99 (+) Transcript_40823:26-322(+)
MSTSPPRCNKLVTESSQILNRVFSFLEPKDMVIAIPTSRSFERAGDQNKIWRKLFEKEFGKNTAECATSEERENWRKHFLTTRTMEMELQSSIYQGSC